MTDFCSTSPATSLASSMMPSIAGQSMPWAFSDQLEHLFQPFDVVLGFAEMRLEALLELRIGGFFNHLWERLHDLLLGIVDVA